MKRCSICNIDFNTSDKYCPLCQNILTGKVEDAIFPENIRYKTNSLVLKIILFTSIVIFLVSGFIEILSFNKVNVTLIIELGLITNYVAISFILRNYQNIYRMFGNF